MPDAQPWRGWPCEWSEQGRGDRRSQEATWRSALQRRHARNRHATCHTVVQRGGCLDGHDHTRTADIEVHVQAGLPRIVLRSVGYGIVVVMVRILVMGMAVMMMAMVVVMVAMVDMVLVANRMSVNEKSREDAGRRDVGHGHGRRHGEHQHHRPHQGDCVSARSFQLRQHLSCHVSPVFSGSFPNTGPLRCPHF